MKGFTLSPSFCATASHTCSVRSATWGRASAWYRAQRRSATRAAVLFHVLWQLHVCASKPLPGAQRRCWPQCWPCSRMLRTL